MIITNNTISNIPAKEIKEVKEQDKKQRVENKQDKSLFQKQELNQNKIDLVEQKINKLTNQMLQSLQSGGANNPKALQIAPNLASDIKNLIQQLEGNEKLQALKNTLNEFIKPIENIKASNIANILQNSGIMLEAKIAQAMDAQSLPNKIKELLSLMKNTSSSELKENFLKLPNDSDAAKSLQDLNKLLDLQKAKQENIINNSSFKNLIKTANGLENAIKFLDKLSNLSKGSSPKQAQNIILKLEDFTDKILKNIKNYDLNNQSDAKNIAQNIIKSTTQLQTALQLLKKGNENFKNFLARNPTNTQNLQNNEVVSFRLNGQNSNPQFTQNILQDKNLQEFKFLNMQLFKDALNQDINGQNLQSKANQITKNINSLLTSLNSDVANAKHILDEVKNLRLASNAASKQIGEISSNDSTAALKELQNDLKSVLLNLKENTANQANLQNINQAVNRLLTQIEIHQLASFTQNSLQTYMPYVWDGVDGSNVSFKRGKKNKFYAKIDLSFVEFGQVSVVLGLSDNKYLDISIQTSKNSFKDTIFTQTTSLKKALNEQGMIVNSFFLSNKNTQNAYEELQEIELGYNIKV